MVRYPCDNPSCIRQYHYTCPCPKRSRDLIKAASMLPTDRPRSLSSPSLPRAKDTGSSGAQGSANPRKSPPAPTSGDTGKATQDTRVAHRKTAIARPFATPGPATVPRRATEKSTDKSQSAAHRRHPSVAISSRPWTPAGPSLCGPDTIAVGSSSSEETKCRCDLKRVPEANLAPAKNAVIENETALPKGTYWVRNIIHSSVDKRKQSWIGFHRKATNRASSRVVACSIDGCPGDGVYGGHVQLKEHPGTQFYFILPLCPVHNAAGGQLDESWLRSRKVQPVAIKWHPKVPLTGNRVDDDGAGRRGPPPPPRRRRPPVRLSYV